MPLRHVRDDERRRFLVTLSGEVTVDELASFVASQILLGAWKDAVLYDATAPGVKLTGIETVLTETWRELSAEHGPRGYVAFAVASDEQRAIAARYADLAKAAGLFTAAVFPDIPSAEAWLDAQAGR